MNNEEKILEILGVIQSDVSGLKTDVADLKTDVADLKTRVTKIEITQENVILPQLQTLAEGDDQKGVYFRWFKMKGERCAPDGRQAAAGDGAAAGMAGTL